MRDQANLCVEDILTDSSIAESNPSSRQVYGGCDCHLNVTEDAKFSRILCQIAIKGARPYRQSSTSHVVVPKKRLSKFLKNFGVDHFIQHFGVPFFVGKLDKDAKRVNISDLTKDSFFSPPPFEQANIPVLKLAEKIVCAMTKTSQAGIQSTEPRVHCIKRKLTYSGIMSTFEQNQISLAFSKLDKFSQYSTLQYHLLKWANPGGASELLGYSDSSQYPRDDDIQSPFPMMKCPYCSSNFSNVRSHMSLHPEQDFAQHPLENYFELLSLIDLDDEDLWTLTMAPDSLTFISFVKILEDNGVDVADFRRLHASLHWLVNYCVGTVDNLTLYYFQGEAPARLMIEICKRMIKRKTRRALFGDKFYHHDDDACCKCNRFSNRIQQCLQCQRSFCPACVDTGMMLTYCDDCKPKRQRVERRNSDWDDFDPNAGAMIPDVPSVSTDSEDHMDFEFSDDPFYQVESPVYNNVEQEIWTPQWFQRARSAYSFLSQAAAVSETVDNWTPERIFDKLFSLFKCLAPTVVNIVAMHELSGACKTFRQKLALFVVSAQKAGADKHIIDWLDRLANSYFRKPRRNGVYHEASASDFATLLFNFFARVILHDLPDKIFQFSIPTGWIKELCDVVKSDVQKMGQFLVETVVSILDQAFDGKTSLSRWIENKFYSDKAKARVMSETFQDLNLSYERLKLSTGLSAQVKAEKFLEISKAALVVAGQAQGCKNSVLANSAQRLSNDASKSSAQSQSYSKFERRIAAPPVLYLVGRTGIGKSFATEWFVRAAAQLDKFENYVGNEESYRFFTSASTKHFDSYKGQPVAVLDDAFQHVSPTSDEGSNFIHMTAGANWIPPMASLDDKGKPFVSKLILASSNVGFPSGKDYGVDNEALLRRLTHHVVVIKNSKQFSVNLDHLDFYLAKTEGAVHLSWHTGSKQGFEVSHDIPHTTDEFKVWQYRSHYEKISKEDLVKSWYRSAAIGEANLNKQRERFVFQEMMRASYSSVPNTNIFSPMRGKYVKLPLEVKQLVKGERVLCTMKPKHVSLFDQAGPGAYAVLCPEKPLQKGSAFAKVGPHYYHLKIQLITLDFSLPDYQPFLLEAATDLGGTPVDLDLTDKEITDIRPRQFFRNDAFDDEPCDITEDPIPTFACEEVEWQYARLDGFLHAKSEMEKIIIRLSDSHFRVLNAEEHVVVDWKPIFKQHNYIAVLRDVLGSVPDELFASPTICPGFRCYVKQCNFHHLLYDYRSLQKIQERMAGTVVQDQRFAFWKNLWQTLKKPVIAAAVTTILATALGFAVSFFCKFLASGVTQQGISKAGLVTGFDDPWTTNMPEEFLLSETFTTSKGNKYHYKKVRGKLQPVYDSDSSGVEKSDLNLRNDRFTAFKNATVLLEYQGCRLRGVCIGTNEILTVAHLVPRKDRKNESFTFSYSWKINNGDHRVWGEPISATVSNQNVVFLDECEPQIPVDSTLDDTVLEFRKKIYQNSDLMLIRTKSALGKKIVKSALIPRLYCGNENAKLDTSVLIVDDQDDHIIEKKNEKFESGIKTTDGQVFAAYSQCGAGFGRGYCGSQMLTEHSGQMKIAGLYNMTTGTAETNPTRFFQPVCSYMVNDMRSSKLGPKTNLPPAMQEGLNPMVRNFGNISFEGQSASHKGHVLKTEICRNGLKDGTFIGFPDQLPAALDFETLSNALIKKGVTGGHVDEIVHAEVIEELSAEYQLQIGRCKRKTAFDALNGIGQSGLEPGLDLKTSPGYPYAQDGKRKLDFLKESGFACQSCFQTKNHCVCEVFVPSRPLYQLNEEMSKNVHDAVDAWDKGELAGFQYMINLKDERRPIEKVKQKASRIVCGGPMDMIIADKMIMGDFVSKFKKRRIEMSHAYGITAQSAEWDQLARKHLAFGKHMAVDYKGFDGSIPSSFIKGGYEIIASCYPQNERTAIRMSGVETSEAEAFCYGYFYQWDRANPSGCYLTTPINCIVNDQIMLYAWKILLRDELRAGRITPNDYMQRKWLSCMRQNTRFTAYGDDYILSVSNPASKIFNPLAISNVVKSLGMQMTSADKTELTSEFVTWDKVSFLSRRFIHSNCVDEDASPQYFGPLEKRVIYDAFFWKHKKHTDEDVKQTWYGMLNECCLWGWDFLEETYYVLAGTDYGKEILAGVSPTRVWQSFWSNY